MIPNPSVSLPHYFKATFLHIFCVYRSLPSGTLYTWARAFLSPRRNLKTSTRCSTVFTWSLAKGRTRRRKTPESAFLSRCSGSCCGRGFLTSPTTTGLKECTGLHSTASGNCWLKVSVTSIASFPENSKFIHNSKFITYIYIADYSPCFSFIPSAEIVNSLTENLNKLRKLDVTAMQVKSAIKDQVSKNI